MPGPGPLRQITSISPGASGQIWSPDGKYILFTSDVYPDCPDDACNQQRDEHHGRTDAQRKQQQPAQPEGETEGRAASEQIVVARPERRSWPAVARRKKIAMKMHRSLGRARRARGEGNEAGIVGRGDEIGEGRCLVLDPRFDAVRSTRVEICDVGERRTGRQRRRQLVGKPRAAETNVEPALSV